MGPLVFLSKISPFPSVKENNRKLIAWHRKLSITWFFYNISALYFTISTQTDFSLPMVIYSESNKHIVFSHMSWKLLIFSLFWNTYFSACIVLYFSVKSHLKDYHGILCSATLLHCLLTWLWQLLRILFLMTVLGRF